MNAEDVIFWLCLAAIVLGVVYLIGRPWVEDEPQDGSQF